MNIKSNGYEIYAKVGGVGFCFMIDDKRKHNYVHPTFLSFFNIGEASKFENIEPVKFSDIFLYRGRQLALCHDNKLRICKVWRFSFEYEGKQFTKLFLCDNSLVVPVILGKEPFIQ